MNPRTDTFSSPSAPPASSLRGPAPLRPLDGVLVDGSDLRLEWGAVPGATEYRVQVASDDAFKTVHFDDRVGTSTSLTLFETFPPNHTRYYWRAAAQLDGAWTAMGVAGSFVAGTEEEYEKRVAQAEAAERPVAPAPAVTPAPSIPEDAPPYLRETTSPALAVTVLLMILFGLILIAVIPLLG